MPGKRMPDPQSSEMIASRVTYLGSLFSPYFLNPSDPKMPDYTNVIPESPRGPSFPIRRTPPGQPLVAIVTSEDLIGTYTHYFKGRTMPHAAQNCPACNDGISYRWHAYLSAWETKSALHFIFEVTAMGAEPFIEYRNHHKTLRGCLFQARRLQNKANGRILIQTKPQDLKELRVPQPPDLAKCLAILWNLPTDSVRTDGYSPEKRTKIAIA